MGCHTWFYRKIERTQDEAKESCLKYLRSRLDLIKKIIENPYYNGQDWKRFLELGPKWTELVITRQIRTVEKDLCQRAVWNNQNDDALTIYVDGKGLYIEDTGYHDLFRRRGYPDDQLFSLEETLVYINDPNNRCDIFPTTVEKVIEFWDKYPEGMICFG